MTQAGGRRSVFPRFIARVRTLPGTDLPSMFATALGTTLTNELRDDRTLRFAGLLVELGEWKNEPVLWGVRVADTEKIDCECDEHWRIIKRLEDALLPLVNSFEPIDRKYTTELYEPSEWEA